MLIIFVKYYPKLVKYHQYLHFVFYQDSIKVYTKSHSEA